jgi:hypothetical protein
MAENERNEVFAETIARVIAAEDLATLTPGDIDFFLSTLAVEPFTEEQVQRILGRLDLGEVAGAGPARPLANPRPRERRVPRSRAVGYRLSCEELETRLPPSVCGAAFDGPVLEAVLVLATVPLAESVQLWLGEQVVESHGGPDREASRPAPWWRRGERDQDPEAEASATATALNGVFASDDYPDSGAAAGLAGIGPHEALPWESLFSDGDCLSTEAGELQLAG